MTVLLLLLLAAAPDGAPEVRRTTEASTPPVASIRPVSSSRSPAAPDATSALLRRSEEGVALPLLVDELLDDLAYELAKEDARALSPMAIRWVKLSPTLGPATAHELEAKLTARLAKVTRIEQAVCTECRSLRSRLEGGDWVVSLGVVGQRELQRIGEELGIKTFLDLDLQYVPGPRQTELTLSARAFRVSDGRVLYASALRADETTAALLRTGRPLVSREERLAELNRKLEARPYYGHLVLLGAAWLPYANQGISGATVGYRIYERFGTDRRHAYGLQAEGFLNPSRLQAGIISAVYAWQASAPDLNRPDLRLNFSVGAFLSGSQANTAIFETSADYIMKFRFSFGLGLLYLVPVDFAGYPLGGFGGRIRFAFNW